MNLFACFIVLLLCISSETTGSPLKNTDTGNEMTVTETVQTVASEDEYSGEIFDNSDTSTRVLERETVDRSEIAKGITDKTLSEEDRSQRPVNGVGDFSGEICDNRSQAKGLINAIHLMKVKN